MSETYTADEAKAKLGEILRKVRAGQRVVISYRGEEVAEIRPLYGKESIEARLKRHREQGTLRAVASRRGALEPLERRSGALARFLKSRD